MEGLLDVAVIVGLFVLRLVAPLVITFAVAYFLRRLDARWQAEAWADWQTGQPEERVIAHTNQLQVSGQPCWSEKGCDEAVKANCPAPKHPSIPCWLARRRSEGRLPAECYNCELFSLRQIA